MTGKLFDTLLLHISNFPSFSLKRDSFLHLIYMTIGSLHWTAAAHSSPSLQSPFPYAVKSWISHSAEPPPRQTAGQNMFLRVRLTLSPSVSLEGKEEEKMGEWLDYALVVCTCTRGRGERRTM